MSAVEKIRKQAAQHEHDRQYDRALAVYAKLLDELAAEEVDVALFNRAGDVAVRAGQVEQAVRFFERALDLYAHGGLLNNAIAVGVKVLRHAPGHAAAHYTLGLLYAKKGFRSDARHHLLCYADRMHRGGKADESQRALGEYAVLADDPAAARAELARHVAAQAPAELPPDAPTLAALLDRVLDAARAVPEPVASPADAARGALADLVFLDVGAEEAGTAPAPIAGFEPTAMDEAPVADAAPLAWEPTAWTPEADAGLGLPSAPSVEPSRDDAAFGATTVAGAGQGTLGDVAPLAYAVALPGEPPLMTVAWLEETPPADVAVLDLVDVGLDVDPGAATDAPALVVDDVPLLDVLDLDVGGPDAPRLDAVGVDAIDLDAIELDATDVDVTTAVATAPTRETLAPTDPEFAADDAIEPPAADDAVGPALDFLAIDAPHADASRVDASFVEPPVVEPPVVEAPMLEAPVVEAPLAEAPAFAMPIAEAPSTATSVAPVAPAPRAPDDDGLDLGAWLRADEPAPTTRMTAAAPARTDDEDLAFAEALRAFKAGVARSVPDADYDSHYDLGVAYQEMGLLDEAIGEFQKASRAPGRPLRPLEALAGCFLARDEPALALAALDAVARDLDAGRGAAHGDEGEPGQASVVGLCYLLASASERLGRVSDARRWYVRVLALDYAFRDAAARLASLPAPD